MKRRHFLRSTMAIGATLSLGASRVLGANDDVRIGAIGMGSFVKIGGKGRKDVRDFQRIPGARVVAICDCDADHLGYVLDDCRKRQENVRAYADFRQLLDDPDIDAVTIATPNHWHSLMTILACQAGKDVFVQKPASHSIYEGRQMVEAMRKYDRIVQATHGPRNSGETEQAYQYVWDGQLGPIQCVYGINYRPRVSIGKVAGPQPIPPSCNYDLWCGPAPKAPLMRKYLHYDWHWDWDTGNGDLGNMGIHAMDGCRWALRKNALPRHVVTVGGRLAYDDDGETPNTLVTLLDYEPVPIIFEVRGLPKNASLRKTNWGKNASRTMDQFKGLRTGTIVQCEGGYVKQGAAYDHRGQLIRQFTRKRVTTKQNFITAVRDRDSTALYSDALEGHLSAGLVHMANISYRLGQHAAMDTIRDAVAGEAELSEAVDRLQQHLAANKIAPATDPVTLGPVLTFDPQAEQFVGTFAERANRLAHRQYRSPFVVPDRV